MNLKSEADTRAVAELVSSFLGDLNRTEGADLGLTGPLGAGKTTFTRHLCSCLGVTGEISSPSYVLQHEYHAPALSIEHWDLYRLSGLPEELYEPVGSGVLRIIEWADRFPDFFDRLRLRLDFDLTHDEDSNEFLRSVTSNFLDF